MLNRTLHNSEGFQLVIFSVFSFHLCIKLAEDLVKSFRHVQCCCFQDGGNVHLFNFWRRSSTVLSSVKCFYIDSNRLQFINVLAGNYWKSLNVYFMVWVLICCSLFILFWSPWTRELTELQQGLKQNW